MAILKADILSWLNSALLRNPAETDVDEQILMVLDDLSDLHVLKDSDLTLTLTDASLYLTYPAEALDDAQAIISVTLTDSSSKREWPLDPLEGGWREYQRQMEGFTDSARSTPSAYVCNDRKIYLLPASNDAYTSEVWFWKRHPYTAAAIEFPDGWRNCLKFGTAMEFALAKKLPDYIAIYTARYEKEKQKRRRIGSDGTAIVGG